MGNKACITIHSCFDCPDVTRGNHYNPDNPTELDDIYCDLEHKFVMSDPNYEVSDVPIPDWCPRLQPDSFVINKPKQFKKDE